MLPDPPGGAPRPIIIYIPGLGDAGVGLPQLSDEEEDSYPILHYIQWLYLGHSLLTEEEVNHPISRPDHQRGLVAVAVECEPRTTTPLMPHLPQHGFTVLLIGCIACVYEEEPPVLLLGVLLPQKPHRVDPPPPPHPPHYPPLVH